MILSVIIPLYNRENYISKAIRSVLDQSYQEFELIIVDDASTDDSLKMVEKFSDSRLRTLVLNENGGNAKARNAGWKNAKGDWIIYLDSDDWLEPTYLENLVRQIDLNSTTSFFWAGVRFVSKTGRILKEEIWIPKGELPSDTFFDVLRVGTGFGSAFKRELLEKFEGFDESFRASVDREFYLRISQIDEGKCIGKILVNCLVGDHESVKKDFLAQSTAYNKLICTYEDVIESTQSRKLWWYHKGMWLALYSGNFKLAENYLRKTSYSTKSIFLFALFLIFPIDIARKLHKKLA